jgi:diguanylate cyclase (GGDEF)-like protein
MSPDSETDPRTPQDGTVFAPSGFRARRVDAASPIATAFVRYVCRLVGAEGLRNAMAQAGIGVERQDEVLAGQPLRHRELMATAGPASIICGDPDLGFRTGQEMFLAGRDAGLADVLLLRGSIGAAVHLAVDWGAKMTRTREVSVIEEGESHVLVEARYNTTPQAFYCGVSRAYYGCVPELYGALFAVGEPECQARGDERCLFRVSWEIPAGVDGPVLTDRAAMKRRKRVDAYFDFATQTLRAASELAGATDVQQLLNRVASGAGVAVGASEFVAAVRMTDDGPTQFATWGFTDRAADPGSSIAEQLVDRGVPAKREGATLIDIASSTRWYGRLACLHGGEEFTGLSRNVLSAYASVAAASLDRLAALEAAAHDRDVAHRLVDLADALAGARYTGEVVERLADAVILLPGVDHASVWQWDAEGACLELASSSDLGPAVAFPHPRIRAVDDRSVRRFVSDPGPVATSAELTDGLSRENVDAAGLSASLVVPIRARGELLGLLLAGSRGTTQDSDHLLALMRGVADQAGTALDNARLLDQVRHQARHDSLTGLLNRGAIEGEARATLTEAAVSDARPAVLFVDLDRFKAVNDSHGHRAGDDLIRQVAERLDTSVRAQDVVGRLGGDEFLVLCRDVGETGGPAELAARIRSVLAEPFVVGDAKVSISCSVGWASFPDDGGDYDALLHRADKAMYASKPAAPDPVPLP